MAARIHLTNYNIIGLLLNKGARINLEYAIYSLALYVAVEVGNVALIPRFLSSSTKLEAQFRGKPALYTTINGGYLITI